MTLPPIELRQSEISELVTSGLLDSSKRGDKLAVLAGFYQMLDEVFAQADKEPK